MEGEELEELWTSTYIFISLFLLSVSYGATVTVLKVGSCTSVGGSGRSRPSCRAILTYTFPPGEVGLLHTGARYTPDLPRLCQHPPDQGIGAMPAPVQACSRVCLSLLRCLFALDDRWEQRPLKAPELVRCQHVERCGLGQQCGLSRTDTLRQDFEEPLSLINLTYQMLATWAHPRSFSIRVTPY